jgi:hypothetical protein
MGYEDALQTDPGMDTQRRYEGLLVYGLLMFLQSLRLYSQAQEEAARGKVDRKDGRFMDGMRTVLEVIEVCGESFQKLPAPPQNALEADDLIRGLGRKLILFAHALNGALASPDAERSERLLASLGEQSRSIRRDTRRFTALYEKAYPGRLSRALESLRGEAAQERGKERNFRETTDLSGARG